MPQFTIELVTARNCDNKIHMGNYSCLVAQFHLKRSISFHLIQNYLPSILIVAVSWVSFWMDIESVPGRISLGVITLLAVSNQATGTSVPQTSYVKVKRIMILVGKLFVQSEHFTSKACFSFTKLFLNSIMQHKCIHFRVSARLKSSLINTSSPSLGH